MISRLSSAMHNAADTIVIIGAIIATIVLICIPGAIDKLLGIDE